MKSKITSLKQRSLDNSNLESRPFILQGSTKIQHETRRISLGLVQDQTAHVNLKVDFGTSMDVASKWTAPVTEGSHNKVYIHLRDIKWKRIEISSKPMKFVGKDRTDSTIVHCADYVDIYLAKERLYK